MVIFGARCNTRPWRLPSARCALLARLRWRLSPLLVILVFVNIGCADTQYVLRYGMENSTPQDIPRWPNPPLTPRYLYAGELLGEANYEAVEPVERSQLETVFNWLVGILPFPAKPRSLQRPVGLLVDSQGRVLVGDVALGQIFVFDGANGKLFIWENASDFGGFISPVGLAEGKAGEILVADSDLGVVVRLDADGTPLGRFGEGVLKRPTGIARDAERGEVYVSDTHAHQIYVFDDEGRLLDTIGGRGERAGEFNYPTFLATRGGLLYVVDTMNARVQVLRSDGSVVRVFGQRGNYVGDFVRPKGVGVDGDGNIYVIESLNDHLLVFDAEGEFLLPIGGEGNRPGEFYLPSGVTVDRDNRVYVTDTFNGRVSIFQFLGAT